MSKHVDWDLHSVIPLTPAQLRNRLATGSRLGWNGLTEDALIDAAPESMNWFDSDAVGALIGETGDAQGLLITGIDRNDEGDPNAAPEDWTWAVSFRSLSAARSVPDSTLTVSAGDLLLTWSDGR